MITQHQIQQIQNLRDQGLTKSKVSTFLDIDRGSVRKYWDVNPIDFLPESENTITSLSNNTSEVLSKIYSYMIGMYLSDGYIVKQSRTYQLRVFLGKKEFAIIEIVSRYLQSLLPNNRVNVYPQKSAECTEVQINSNSLPRLFPCVESGQKYKSIIPFEVWQLNIIKKYPKEFILGCLHGDGSCYMSGSYKRYSFSNMSLQIRTLFQQACLQIGIPTKCYSNKTIPIYKQSYISIIDTFWINKC